VKYCQSCGLYFQDEEEKCPECGGPLEPALPEEEDFAREAGEAPGSPEPLQAPPPASPKKRNTLILLCYFLGMFGAHRFYLGKVFTGALMALTFGGLTIWQAIDFARAVFGRCSDSQGRPLDRGYNAAMVVILIVFPAILIVAASMLLFLWAFVWFRRGGGLSLG
jgi:TM2 domain-containing membrane protein YozV